MAGRFVPLNAKCPTTGGVIQYRLTSEVAEDVIKRGPKVRYHELAGDKKPDAFGSCVQDVLASPAVVYGNIRDYQQGGMSYCGLPSASWTEEGCMCPPKPGQVFAVYINPRNEVYGWRWVKADKENPNIPEDRSGMKVTLWPKP